MPKLKLIILPSGKVVIVTDGKLSDDEKASISQAWAQAQSDDKAVAVIDECEVIRAGEK